jgi:hypothetical protein
MGALELFKTILQAKSPLYLTGAMRDIFVAACLGYILLLR